ncbi:MAG: hypothetical protein JOZ29_08685 [Deltaproteobacteria bacterium]|nr:hypothetical protein [Deltaproteobacteria bacterium]
MVGTGELFKSEVLTRISGILVAAIAVGMVVDVIGQCVPVLGHGGTGNRRLPKPRDSVCLPTLMQAAIRVRHYIERTWPFLTASLSTTSREVGIAVLILAGLIRMPGETQEGANVRANDSAAVIAPDLPQHRVEPCLLFSGYHIEL